jgi:16S rRNA (uracil1498-N3)-methyltransferase
VRWEGEKGARQVTRLRAVARSAAMQSRRVRLPAVHDVCDFAAAAALAVDLGRRPGAALAHPGGRPGAALAHPGGRPPGLDRPAVLVGPEGGFTDDELGCGLPAVDLGSTNLRAETAAMAAGVLLCAIRSNLVRPAT